MPSKTKFIAGIVLTIIILSGITLYYSYKNIEASINSIELGDPPIKINKSKALLIGLTAILSGGATLPMMLDAVEGINLIIGVEIHNGGMLPIQIHSINYKLYINDIYVGDGWYNKTITIQSGQNNTIDIHQTINKDNLLDIANSIIENRGLAKIGIKGEIKVSLAGLNLNLQFDKQTTIDLYNTIKDALIDYLSKY